MGLFSKKEPTILKDSCSAYEQLSQLESLRGSLSCGAEQRLERDIRLLRAGVRGEEKILFELKNSHMDMFVLRDLHLEFDGLSAQIDFLVLTQQRSFVIECKNLVGDLEITDKGDFIRVFDGQKKEGIYSPITQNRRHIQLIREMRQENRGFLANIVASSSFDDVYRSLIVLANPKTILDNRCASQEISSQVIRADQLIETIRAINNEKGPGRDKAFPHVIKETAEWFLSKHRAPTIDYTAKYRDASDPSNETPPENVASGAPFCPRCGAPMVLRTATKGERAGRKFYGCSTYPRCRGIVNLEK